MGLILSIIKRKNIDDIFSYKTQKIVKVRDRRLGKYFFKLFIKIKI